MGDSEVKINWGTVDGAATYHVQMSNDVSPLVWQEFAGNLVTDTKTEISDLPTGEKLWFRVIAVNYAVEGKFLTSNAGWFQLNKLQNFYKCGEVANFAEYKFITAECRKVLKPTRKARERLCGEGKC